MPWILTRHALSVRWHVPPWVVDEAPVDEIDTELRLMEIEAAAAATSRR